MIEGAILAIVVVFIFLRDWRATLIAAIALPLSIVPAFWAIDAAGFSLNLVSLLAITIVTGILVDDAIVEIENIVRHMRMGKSPYRAALEAADEIGLAVIAITLHHHRRVRAGELHGRHRRAILQAVRPGRRLRRVLLAAGGAADHAAARRLLHARHRITSDKEGWLLRAYTRLVRWSVAHHYKTVALGLADLRRLHRQLLPAPRGLPARRRQRPHCCSPSSCRPARAWPTRAPSPTPSPATIRARTEVKSVFINGGRVMGSGAEVRKATLDHQPGAEGEAQAHPGPGARRDRPQPRRRARHPLLVPEGQRPAPAAAGGLGPRRRGRQPRRGRADQPGQAHSAARQRGVDGRARPPGAAGGADHRHRRRARRLHRGHLRGGAHRHHRRHRRQSRQVRRRRPAGADPGAARGARARRPADAGIAQGGDRLGRRRAAVGRGPLRAGPGPDRHRPLRPHAPRRHRRRPRRRRAARQGGGAGDGAAGGQEACLPASRSSSSATPRSWARCSRASPRPWAPAS